MRRRHIAACVLAGAYLSGCFSPNSDLTDDMPEPIPPPRMCTDTEGTSGGDMAETESCGSTGVAADVSTSEGTGTPDNPLDACQGDEDCLGNNVCAAEWLDDEERRRPFECRFACVDTLDEAIWCADDAACCDPDAHCTARGYCVVDE